MASVTLLSEALTGFSTRDLPNHSLRLSLLVITKAVSSSPNNQGNRFNRLDFSLLLAQKVSMHMAALAWMFCALGKLFYVIIHCQNSNGHGIGSGSALL